jgi:hypothetical protein
LAVAKGVAVRVGAGWVGAARAVVASGEARAVVALEVGGLVEVQAVVKAEARVVEGKAEEGRAAVTAAVKVAALEVVMAAEVTVGAVLGGGLGGGGDGAISAPRATFGFSKD